MSRAGEVMFWTGLILAIVVVVTLAALSAPRDCTGGGKGTGEPVRCER